MGYVTTGTIGGFLRSDGTTLRNVTMNRVGNVVNGFVMRETDVDPALAQKLTYRSIETKSPKGLYIRTVVSIWEWPYELPTAPGVVAGTVIWNKTGLHIPSNCPTNVRLDVRNQITNLTSSSAGTLGKYLFYDPLIMGQPAF